MSWGSANPAINVFIPKTETIAYTYDSQGRILTCTTVQNGQTRIETYAYNVDSTVASITVTVS